MDVSQESRGQGGVRADLLRAAYYPFQYIYPRDSRITVEAVPEFGYRFERWSGDISGTTNPMSLVMDCNKSVTASFGKDYSLLGLFVSSAVIVGLMIAAAVLRKRERPEPAGG